QPVQGVYRIDPDGRVSLVAANAGKPNGIAVSPDQATLYVASIDNGSFDENLPPETPTAPGRMALLAYDLAGDGSAKFRRTVVDFSRSEEHTSELQSRENLVCRLLLEKKNSICNTALIQAISSKL